MTATDADGRDAECRVRLPASTLREYRRFSLYNSPYPAHDAGCAIDLYPATNDGRSPVAGEVIETRTVRAPSKSYADDEEYLILVDVDLDASGIDVESPAQGLVARVLHVQPSVAPGDRVGVGASLGSMVRSGFFAPWVENHVHVGFRRPSQHLHRAGGSVPIDVGVDVEPLPWDGTGTVIEVGETYALLDAPAHPASGERFAGVGATIAAEGGRETTAPAGRVALDGGFAHYAAGGALGSVSRDLTGETVSFLGHPVGARTDRTVAWRDVDVLANGDRITGLSLFVGIDPSFGAKLVCPDWECSVGERVRVTVRDSDDPIRLG